MNKKIVSFVAQSINQLKGGLSKKGISVVKTELNKIYKNEVSVNESYENIRSSSQIPAKDIDAVYGAFYDLGSLLARKSSSSVYAKNYIRILGNAYEGEGIGDDFDSFVDDVTNYVNNEVSDM